MSLSGPPGVCKTLTAESGMSRFPRSKQSSRVGTNRPQVAEVLKVPLYVLDLGQVSDELDDNHVPWPVQVDKTAGPVPPWPTPSRRRHDGRHCCSSMRAISTFSPGAGRHPYGIVSSRVCSYLVPSFNFVPI